MSGREHPQDQVLPTLLEKGLINAKDLERAERLADTDQSQRGAAYQMVKMGALAPRDLVMELANAFNVQAVDLSAIDIKEETLDLLPEHMVIDKGVLPVSRQGKKLYVAMADPTDIDVLDEVRFATNDQVTPVVADTFSIEQVLESRYAVADDEEDFDAFMDEIAGDEVADVEVVEEEEIAQLAVQEEVESAPVVQLINRVLIDAVKRGASDVHFEIYENETRIRYRIDGALLPVASPPKKWDKAMVSRLKIISKLNIGERRIPQDGRTTLKVGNRVVDFRVSTLPCTFGEKIVLRILDKSVVSLDLDNLGIDGREKEIIQRAVKSPVGMLLVTGPTGSGKTTTLYSVLAQINRPDTNLMTVEDPVEYDLPGINQVAVRKDIGLDFSKALKAFLRQDPDVIMVGEIRDRETADIAVRAALTGHLVLSTIHTNDAPSTVTRLTEMGVERFNIASALVGVVAQRLVRKICKACKRPYEPSAQELRFARLSEEEASRIEFKHGTGCARCDGTGYRGRTGLYEVLPLTNDIAEMIIAGSTATEIKQKAIREGMQTLRMTGMNKVREGITTLDEVIRHTSL